MSVMPSGVALVPHPPINTIVRYLTAVPQDPQNLAPSECSAPHDSQNCDIPAAVGLVAVWAPDLRSWATSLVTGNPASQVTHTNTHSVRVETHIFPVIGFPKPAPVLTRCNVCSALLLQLSHTCVWVRAPATGSKRGLPPHHTIESPPSHQQYSICHTRS